MTISIKIEIPKEERLLVIAVCLYITYFALFVVMMAEFMTDHVTLTDGQLLRLLLLWMASGVGAVLCLGIHDERCRNSS